MCCCLLTKLCPTLCDPMLCSPPGFSVHGISQVRILEWVAISFLPQGIVPTQESNLHISCVFWIGRQVFFVFWFFFFTTKPLGKPMKIYSFQYTKSSNSNKPSSGKEQGKYSPLMLFFPPDFPCNIYIIRRIFYIHVIIHPEAISHKLQIHFLWFLLILQHKLFTQTPNKKFKRYGFNITDPRTSLVVH